MENRLLSIQKLRTYFRTEEGLRKAVDGVSLGMERGNVVGIAGESGCGKSTLCLSVMRLITKPGRIEGGEIWFDSQNLFSLTGAR